ncbi:MAG: nucleotide sugar dehydrogenase [Nitrospiraceae bacterium]|nr:nucleotide sugar dehydrogenase [Nitrospiraceae bacterium]
MITPKTGETIPERAEPAPGGRLELIEKIRSREARIGVIGLGYVGLPLVSEFSRAGFDVTGFDIDAEKVNLLKQGKSYIRHIDGKKIRNLKSFIPTTDFSHISEMDCIIACVPTPLNANREPDMTYVFGTAMSIAGHLRRGQLIVLESTTYPGTTDEDMKAILERNIDGLKAGIDFYLAYSPEREDPNNHDFSTRTIPKVVGGYTQKCLGAAKALYDTIVVRTIPVSSTRVAETTKLLENIYRAVNIALVNELKGLFERMDIDIWEVIEASKTKPFGFQAFYPGPGLGGHCIPIDPFYLTWKARQYDCPTKFIELAGEINTAMPYRVVERTGEALNECGKCLKGAKVLVLGLAYKKDVDDTRESPSFKLMEILEGKGAIVDYNDPFIPVAPKMRRFNVEKISVPLTAENLKSYDCVLVATDHSAYDPRFILEHSKLIVDTRNLIKDGCGDLGKIKKA